jgi:hypothetical protein
MLHCPSGLGVSFSTGEFQWIKSPTPRLNMPLGICLHMAMNDYLESAENQVEKKLFRLLIWRRFQPAKQAPTSSSPEVLCLTSFTSLEMSS